jgi:hypothetical protein
MFIYTRYGVQILNYYIVQYFQYCLEQLLLTLGPWIFLFSLALWSKVRTMWTKLG